MVGNLAFVGLTGGIGSGKSTVARMAAALGVPVIDADQLGREVVAPGQPAHAEIAAAWPDVVAADGTLDRHKLGARVFADPEQRAQLEAIMHPRIAQRALERARQLEAEGHRLALYEASLLVETGRQRDFDALIVVTAPTDTQVRRVVGRDQRSADEARARIDAQFPLEKKLEVATHVIDNSGSLENTRAQVSRLIDELRARFGA